MKGICLFELHGRERPSGARPYGESWRLTPECELFEWALLDANKSGTAENFYVFVSLHQKEAEFFYPLRPNGKDRVPYEKF